MLKPVDDFARVSHRAVAPVQVEALPSKKVLTGNGVRPDVGTVLYAMYAPSVLTAYEIVMDVAFLHPQTQEWHVVVLGPRLPVMSVPARNFTTDTRDWVKRWKKRNPGQAVPEIVKVH